MYARSLFRRLCHDVNFSSSWCESLPLGCIVPSMDPDVFGWAEVHGVSQPGVRFCASVNGTARVGGMSIRNRPRLIIRGGIAGIGSSASEPSCSVDGVCSSSWSRERRRTDTESHGMDLDRALSRGRLGARCRLGDRGMEPESVGRCRVKAHHRDGPGSSGAPVWEEDWRDVASEGREAAVS